MILETRNLTKTFSSKRGCHNINLAVKPSQIFGLLGPNGAGKSTFVKMIVGLLHPSSGEATVFGYPLGSVESRKGLGYLPELFRYQDWLSAIEILAFHARLNGLQSAEVRSAKMTKRINEVLYEVGLEGRGQDRVKQFSKGMQQRLGLACALLLEPDLLVLDEPCSAMDPLGRYEVRQILKRYHKQGKTIFLNTHLLEDVEAICDEVAFLQQGELKAVGTLEQIMHPAKCWRFIVGGWLAEMPYFLDAVRLQSIEIQVQQLSSDGSAILQADLLDREQAGWLNAKLVEEGVTVYESYPLQSSLEDWFLNLAAQKRGDVLS